MRIPDASFGGLLARPCCKAVPPPGHPRPPPGHLRPPQATPGHPRADRVQAAHLNQVGGQAGSRGRCCSPAHAERPVQVWELAQGRSEGARQLGVRQEVVHCIVTGPDLWNIPQGAAQPQPQQPPATWRAPDNTTSAAGHATCVQAGAGSLLGCAHRCSLRRHQAGGHVILGTPEPSLKASSMVPAVTVVPA